MRRRPRPPDAEHFRLFAFGSDEELVEAFGNLERAEQAWQSARERFLDRWEWWGMPQAWWRFEPGVPEELRTGPPAVISEADAAHWASIDESRRRYLASIGIEPTPTRRRRPG